MNPPFSIQRIFSPFRITLAVLGLSLSLSAAQPSPTPNQAVSLAFDYPTNFWQSVNSALLQVTNPAAWPAVTNMTVRIYSATNLLGTNTQWTLASVTPNPSAQTNGNYVYYLFPNVPIAGAQTFYSATISNTWGTSFFSALAATAPPPISQGSFLIQSAR